MNIYEVRDVYSQDTGKKIQGEVQRVFKCEACDYCGELLEEGTESVSYEVHESGDIEQQWYYDSLMVKGESINIGAMLSHHPRFIYCNPWEGNACECKMMQEKHTHDMFCNLMYECRYKVIKKLCETYSFDELQLETI